jgi:hypothetical protein
MPRIVIPHELFERIHAATNIEEHRRAVEALEIATAGSPEEHKRQKEISAAMALIKDDSDRSVGIVCGSFLESELEQAIRRYFRPSPCAKLRENTNRLFQNQGPLGAFATKIDIGALIGIYDEEVWRTLVTIKDIRNKFAHKLSIRSFDKEPISSLCANLTFVDKYFQEENGQFFERRPYPRDPGEVRLGYPPDFNPLDTHRKRFVATCVFLYDPLNAAQPDFRHPVLHNASGPAT